MSKTFITPISTVMKTVITVGQICGTMIWKKILPLPRPVDPAGLDGVVRARP